MPVDLYILNLYVVASLSLRLPFSLDQRGAMSTKHQLPRDKGVAAGWKLRGAVPAALPRLCVAQLLAPLLFLQLLGVIWKWNFALSRLVQHPLHPRVSPCHQQQPNEPFRTSGVAVTGNSLAHLVTFHNGI